MQIISINDCDFPSLLHVLQNAKHIGTFKKNGLIQIVRASDRFLLISPEENPQKIAIKPVRTQNEADQLGRQFLAREKQRGSDVEEGVKR